MPAQTYDLIVEQGADYELTIPVLDDDDQPVSLVGWSAAGQIRGTHLVSRVLHTLDLTVVGTNVALRIPGMASSRWAWRRARYDLELVDPDGGVTRLLQGAVEVLPEVTRSPVTPSVLGVFASTFTPAF